MKKNNPIPHCIAVTLFLFALLGTTQILFAREGIKTIALLPIHINAPEELDHIQKGMGHMLYSRLSWKNNVLVIPEKTISEHLSRMGTPKNSSSIDKIARLTDSDYVLAGAITQLGGSFSIDIQVYDIQNKRYMAFFEQSQKKDDLIQKTNRIAAYINKTIFERTTMEWEKMDREQQAEALEQKRKNPEYMMKKPEWQETKKSPGWKIWKYLF